MELSSRTRPISYLKSHAAEIARELNESREPLLITQNGEARLVVMDVHSFEAYEETLALLKIPALGRRELDAGQFRTADEVFADLDLD